MAMGKILLFGVTGIGVLVASAAAYVRIAELPEDRLTARVGPMEAGEHIAADGIKVVIPLVDLPEEPFDRMLGIIAATPRTERHIAQSGYAVFVTRSAGWGFPDIAVVWVQNSALHIHSALVYGRSDLGVNAARVKGWIAALTS